MICSNGVREATRRKLFTAMEEWGFDGRVGPLKIIDGGVILWILGGANIKKLDGGCIEKVSVESKI